MSSRSAVVFLFTRGARRGLRAALVKTGRPGKHRGSTANVEKEPVCQGGAKSGLASRRRVRVREFSSFMHVFTMAGNRQKNGGDVCFTQILEKPV